MVAEEAEEAASVTGGGQEIASDPVDSEPCHFYCMSARKCCSLTKQVHNDIFFKDGLLNKKFVVIQYSLCNLFLVGGVFLTVIPLSWQIPGLSLPEGKVVNVLEEHQFWFGFFLFYSGII